jgi:hypothetical protein
MRGTQTGRPELDQESLEDAIAQVKGVFACQVVVDDQQQVQEVHAIGTAQRGAKQIVRDIETLLRVRFGFPIDYRKISLVQLDEVHAKQMFDRPQLCSVQGSASAEGYTVAVVVQQDKQDFRGVASGGQELLERLSLAARATLHAVGQIVHREELLSVDDARLLPLGGKEVVAVALSVWFSTGNEQLVGLSIVREEDDLAAEMLASAARATLSALNRRLPLILSQLGEAPMANPSYPDRPR